MLPPWRLRLLGALEATRGAVQLSRFPSRAAAALMARLALQPDRAHDRKELVELLCPGMAIDIGRNRLRQALSTLKALLEADGPPVLLADRLSIRVLPGALDSDVLKFNAALRRGDPKSARAWYRGELMPGHDDDWMLQERLRMAAQFECMEAPPTLLAVLRKHPPRPGRCLGRRAGAGPHAGDMEAEAMTLRMQFWWPSTATGTRTEPSRWPSRRRPCGSVWAIAATPLSG